MQRRRVLPGVVGRDLLGQSRIGAQRKNLLIREAVGQIRPRGFGHFEPSFIKELAVSSRARKWILRCWIGARILCTVNLRREVIKWRR